MCDLKPLKEEIIKTEELEIPDVKNEQFNCNQCEYVTTCSVNLERHALLHSEEKYACDVCDFRTKHAVLLIRHMKKHSACEQYKCNICNYTSMQERDLQTHIQTHTPQVCHQCDKCSFHCDQLSELQLHADTHNMPCKYRGRPRNRFAFNREDFVSTVIEGKETTDATFVEDNVNIKYKEFLCDVCNFKCDEKPVFYLHLKTHCVGEPFSCDLCDYITIQKYDLITHHSKTHITVRNRKRYIFSCNYCDFKSAWLNLKMHLRRHYQELQFVCNICHYRFGRNYHLQRHMKRKHDTSSIVEQTSCKLEKTVQLECKFCDYKTAIGNNLIKHIKIQHIGFYKCMYCNYKTSKKYTLKIHTIRTHNAPFGKHKRVYMNVKTHQAKLKEKPGISSHQNTITHKKVFKCDEEHHLPIETLQNCKVIEKNLACNFCKYRCEYKNQLRRHLMRHSKQVFLCDFTSLRKVGLQSHATRYKTGRLAQ